MRISIVVAVVAILLSACNRQAPTGQPATDAAAPASTSATAAGEPAAEEVRAIAKEAYI